MIIISLFAILRVNGKVVDMIPGINFVEQRHQDEYIENHGEVNVACSRLGTLIFGTLKQKMSKTCNEQVF